MSCVDRHTVTVTVTVVPMAMAMAMALQLQNKLIKKKRGMMLKLAHGFVLFKNRSLINSGEHHRVHSIGIDRLLCVLQLQLHYGNQHSSFGLAMASRSVTARFCKYG